MLHECVLLSGSWHSFGALWSHATHLVLNLLRLETVVDSSVVNVRLILGELASSACVHVSAILIRLLSKGLPVARQTVLLIVSVVLYIFVLLHLVSDELVVLWLSLIVLHVDHLFSSIVFVLILIIVRHHVLEVVRGRVLIPVHLHKIDLNSVSVSILPF